MIVEFSRNDTHDAFANDSDSLDKGQFPLLVNKDILDNRLLAGTQMLAVKIEDTVHADPLHAGGRLEMINDLLVSQPIAISIAPTKVGF